MEAGTAKARLAKAADQQGWGINTQLAVVLEFVEDQGQLSDFSDYLTGRICEEEAGPGESVVMGEKKQPSAAREA